MEFIRRNHKPIAFVLLLLVILTIVWSFYREWDAIGSFPWKIQLVYLLLAVSAYSLQLLLMFITWHRMVQSMTLVSNINLDAGVYFISAAARRIPTPVWYLGSRFTLYPPDSVPSSVVMLCSALELALLGLAGTISLVIFVPFYSGLHWEYTMIIIIAGLIIVGTCIGYPAFVVQLINILLGWLKKKKIDYKISRSHLIEWTRNYIGVYILHALALYGTILGVIDIHMGINDIMIIGTIYMILAYVSMFLTAGFGLKELATGLLFTRWMPFSIGIVITLLFRVLMTLVEILFVIFVKIFISDFRNRKRYS